MFTTQLAAPLPQSTREAIRASVPDFPYTGGWPMHLTDAANAVAAAATSYRAGLCDIAQVRADRPWSTAQELIDAQVYAEGAACRALRAAQSWGEPEPLAYWQSVVRGCAWLKA